MRASYCGINGDATDELWAVSTTAAISGISATTAVWAESSTVLAVSAVWTTAVWAAVSRAIWPAWLSARSDDGATADGFALSNVYGDVATGDDKLS